MLERSLHSFHCMGLWQLSWLSWLSWGAKILKLPFIVRMPFFLQLPSSHYIMSFLGLFRSSLQARLSSRNDHRPGDREDTLPSVPKTSKAEMWMRYESHSWCTAVWEWIPQKISQNVTFCFQWPNIHGHETCRTAAEDHRTDHEFSAWTILRLIANKSR